jgi:hypothetical protein
MSMAVKGSCHCGAVTIEVPSAPEWLASCNCSICKRTGVLMAYYPPGAVRVEGETATYLTGDRYIRIHHCRACPCLTHWTANPDALAGELPEEVRAALAERMGVNARLLDGYEVREGRSLFEGREVEVRFMDNAD